MAKYICKNDPTHIFDEPTADFWCPICVGKKGMLNLVEDEEHEDSISKSLSNEIDGLKSKIEEINNQLAAKSSQENPNANLVKENNEAIDPNGSFKLINCGKCKIPIKINVSKVELTKFAVICKECGTKNLINIAPTSNAAKAPSSPPINNPVESKRPKLKVLLSIENNGVVKTKGLVLGSNIIGRSDMQNDKYLSNKHCDIRLNFKGKSLRIEIVDLKSTNGTFDFNKNKLVPMHMYIVKLNVFYYIGSSKIKITL